jgi:DNA-binding HxlR family transcriptional regulator
VREYGQYCPVALGSEVVSDRWTPLILREMILGSTRFNDIERGLPGISRSLLKQRLEHLGRKGVVELRPAAGGRGNEYHLTAAGRDLEPVIMALGEWSVRWLYAEPLPAQIDPITLTWWMHRRVEPTALPDQRVTIEFDYRKADPSRIWMVLDRGEPSVCFKHPGFEPDVVVTAEPVDLMRVFSGSTTLSAAVAEGSVGLAGLPTLTRRFGSWFTWSPFAPAVRERVRADRTAGPTSRRGPSPPP